MHSILTKALETYYNDFFSLSEEEQDIWKLSEHHDDIDKKIEKFVKDALDFNDKEDPSPNTIFEYNKIMLHYTGIGPNKFMLNEWTWDSQITSYDNLYTYNIIQHNFQEEALHVSGDKHTPKKLCNRFSDWARAEIDQKFSYLNIVSLESWLYWKIEDVCDVWIEKQIPHTYDLAFTKANNGAPGGSVNAYGLEQWYDILNTYRDELLLDILENSTYIRDVVYIITTNELATDPCKDYVFGSLDVLKHIKFVSFIADCDAIQGDPVELDVLKNTIITEVKQKLILKLRQIKEQYPISDT